MVDLNMMLRDQARLGLQSQMDAAVAEGNAEKVRKIADDIAKLDLATAPAKAVPKFGDTDVRAELDKLPWFGIDPKKSAKAIEFAKNLEPKKFADAAAFVAAIAKAVDEDGKPAAPVTTTEPPENETDEEREAREAEEAEAAEAAKAAGKPRKTDGPNDSDRGNGGPGARRTGPWTKLSDAPREVQAEIRRTADRFVPAKAPKEQREKYIANALSSHYAAYQRNKGKK